MGNNIWIINEYAGSAEHGMNFRHYYLSKEFIKNGNTVTIISASYSHIRKKNPDMGNNIYKPENIDGINFLWIKVLKYTKSLDKKRILKWFQFAYRLLFVPGYIDNRPDTIICSPTAPFPVISAYYLAKKYKAKLVFETRDIWPLTLVEVGGFSKNHPFIIFMKWFEKFALKKADIIVSNLSNYGQHITDCGIHRDFIYIPNGIDLDELNQQQELDRSVVDIIPKERFVIGYTGAVGLANAMDSFIDAAILLREKEDIVFVIVGNGQEKEGHIQKADGLNNVIFIPVIPKRQVQSMLKLFDVCYIGLGKKKLYEYGVSPNKLFDYMFSGKPILHAISTKNDLVSMADCGKTVEAENARVIADGILKFYMMPRVDRDRLGENGKKFVLEYHNYSKLAGKFEEIINRC